MERNTFVRHIFEAPGCSNPDHRHTEQHAAGNIGEMMLNAATHNAIAHGGPDVMFMAVGLQGITLLLAASRHPQWADAIVRATVASEQRETYEQNADQYANCFPLSFIDLLDSSEVSND